MFDPYNKIGTNFAMQRVITLEAQMQTHTLGDLISSVYEGFMSLYKDAELAAIATAAFINEMLTTEKATKIEGFAA